VDFQSRPLRKGWLQLISLSMLILAALFAMLYSCDA